MNTQKLHAKKTLVLYVIFVLILIGLLVLVIPFTRAKLRETLSYTYAHLSTAAVTPFPEVDTSDLNDIQKKIVKVTRDEYKNKPVSYDSSVLKYSEGNKEAWCADFTSWVMKAAGAPYSNPNSGHWRIPGVLTLKEYYQSENRYVSSNRGYVPQIGDVAIYIGEKTLDGRSQQHANIVLSIRDDQMITIGGNERGRMRITTQSYSANQNSLVGFGTLEKVEASYAQTN